MCELVADERKDLEYFMAVEVKPFLDPSCCWNMYLATMASKYFFLVCRPPNLGRINPWTYDQFSLDNESFLWTPPPTNSVLYIIDTEQKNYINLKPTILTSYYILPS